MRILTHRRAVRRRGPLGRAATMIEFALVFPIFIFMIVFSIDMGLMMLTAGSMSDTAFSAARAGAQSGGGAYNPVTRSTECDTACTPSSNTVTRQVVEDAEAVFPLGSVRSFNVTDTRVTSGGRCSDSGPNSFVRVELPYRISFLTPGLTAMVAVADGSSPEQYEGTNMRAVGVARCEITR